MKKGAAVKDMSYVTENVNVLLPKMESIKFNLDKVPFYNGKDLDVAYQSTCRSVEEDISILRGIVQYGQAYKVKIVDDMSKRLLSYMSELGHFQSVHSKKN